MKKAIIIFGFLALLLLVLAYMDNDEINKLLEKKDLTDKEQEKLKQLRNKIDQKLQDSGNDVVEEAQVVESKTNEMPPQPKTSKEETMEKENIKVEDKDKEKTATPEKEEKKEEKPEIETKPCRMCGTPIPKYPINVVYCPTCQEKIKAEKQKQKATVTVKKMS
jgi:hypothetical protein